MIKKQFIKEIIGKVRFLVFPKAFMVCENSVCRFLSRLIRRNKKNRAVANHDCPVAVLSRSSFSAIAVLIQSDLSGSDWR